jgi:hypothetical protein
VAADAIRPSVVAAPAPHSKLLTQAAREVLQPMGLIQKGRSRTWLDDHGWWLCVVEFQPSGFTKGSYLNVGAMWLWRRRDDIYYAVGYRVEEAPFVKFQSEQQFEPVAKRFAELAALEVSKYRAMFPDLLHAARFLEREGGGVSPEQDAFDAGIAWGLLGERGKAEKAFERHNALISGYLKSWEGEGWFCADEEHYRNEADEERAESRRLRGLLADVASFRKEVLIQIETYRRSLKLPQRDVLADVR